MIYSDIKETIGKTINDIEIITLGEPKGWWKNKIYYEKMEQWTIIFFDAGSENKGNILIQKFWSERYEGGSLDYITEVEEDTPEFVKELIKYYK